MTELWKDIEDAIQYNETSQETKQRGLDLINTYRQSVEKLREFALPFVFINKEESKYIKIGFYEKGELKIKTIM